MNQVIAVEMVFLRRSAGMFKVDKANTRVEENTNYRHYRK
jgi:hypothetical protein